MKKVIILLIVALCSTMVMKAQTTYGIRIGTVAVTSLNANDVLDDGGSIKYNATDKILTLNNAKIEGETYGINTTEENLTIEVLGSNTFAATTNGIRANCKKLTIIGDGTLTLSGQYAINLYNTDLSINNTNLSISCTDTGILTATNDDVVEISKSNISIRSIQKTKKIVPFGQFGSVTLSGCEISSPTGATYDTGKGAIVVADTIYKGNLAIKKIEERKYCRFTGNDLDVTVSNIGFDETMEQINSKMLKSGSISIDTTNRVMYLENVRPKNDLSLYQYIGGFTISLTGVNNMSYIKYDITEGAYDVSIMGSGELSLLGSIDCKNAYLSISDCKLTVNTYENEYGSIYGIENAQLNIVRAEVEVIQASEYTPIVGFDEFTLEDCSITSHEGATYDKTKKVLVDNNNKEIRSTVTIAPVEETVYCMFYIDIDGDDESDDAVQVRNTNLAWALDLINNDFLESGTITFDVANNIMHLNNVREKETVSLEIDNNMDIDLIGENQLSFLSNFNEAAVTISGEGELTVKYNIYWENANLEIKDCKVTVNTEEVTYGGISGISEAILTINNAELTVLQTEGNNPLSDFADVVLIMSEVTSHEGATYDKTKRAFVDNSGNEIKTTITIAPKTIEDTGSYFMFCGTNLVTKDNCSDLSILCPAGTLKSGSISFVPETRTIVLNNVEFEATSALSYELPGFILFSSEFSSPIFEAGIQIEVIGNNKISCGPNVAFIGFEYLFTFTGGGTLELYSEGMAGDALPVTVASLAVVDETTVEIHTGQLPSVFFVDSHSTLTVYQSNLYLYGGGVDLGGEVLPTVVNLTNTKITNCEVTCSAGAATFDATKLTFVDNAGNPITDGVFIRATPTGIENVAINRNEAIKIFKDGQVLIIRDGKQYNALGQLMN